MTTEAKKVLMDTQEVVAVTGLPRDTVDILGENGSLRRFKLGKRNAKWWYYRADVEKITKGDFDGIIQEK